MSQEEQVVEAVSVSKTKVPSLEERVSVVTKSFSSFDLRLSRDSIGKKKLSNKLVITIPDSRSESRISLTLREAKTLKNFLNKHLAD
jgi:hypothetical protein